MEWIKPIDELPESEEFVLVTVMPGTQTSAGYDMQRRVHAALFVNDPSVDGTWYPFFELIDDDDRRHMTEEILAWMPMPEPYKGE